MATIYATAQYRADGTNRRFGVPFPYLDPSHIVGEVNGIAATYTMPAAGFIDFDVAPPKDAYVRVYRATPIDQKQVNFVNGSSLLDSDLNGADLQLLYGLQDLADKETLYTQSISDEASIRAAAIAQEVADRQEAVSTETAQRVAAIAQEVADRKAAIDKEAADRQQAIVTYFGQNGQTGTGGIVDGAVTLPKIGEDVKAAFQDYTQAATGAVLRTIVAKLSDRLELADFVPTASLAAARAGTIDAAPYVQALLNAVKALGGGVAKIGAGQWRLDSQVSCTDVDIAIVGEGAEVTTLLVNNTTGGILLQDTQARTVRNVLFGLRDLTIVAAKVGNCGRAVSFIGKPGQVVAIASPQVLIRGVVIRSTTYSADTSNPYWGDCFYMQDVSGAMGFQFYTIQPFNKVCAGIHIDNSNSSYQFKFTFSDYSLQGGGTGMLLVGWLENVQLSNFDISEPVTGISMDATASGGNRQIFELVNGHINASSICVLFRNCHGIKLANVNIFLTSDASSYTQYGVYLDGCYEVFMTNCVVNGGYSTQFDTDLMMVLNSYRVHVSNCNFQLTYQANRTSRAVMFIQGSTNSIVSGCIFESLGGFCDAGLFSQPGITNERLTFRGNAFTAFSQGIVVVDADLTSIVGNDFWHCVSGIHNLGTAPTGNLFMASNNGH